MMRPAGLWSGVLLVCAVATCSANLGAVFGGHGGTVEALAEHPTVRMVSERVEATIGDERAQVECTYRFANEGPATVVTMGFPELTAGFVPRDQRAPGVQDDPALEGFTLTADGQAVPTELRVAARRALDGPRADDTPADKLPTMAKWVMADGAFGVIARWHVAEVPFAEGQPRTIQVRYEQALGESAGFSDSRWFRYWAGTAASWKGDLDEATFTFHLDLPPGTRRFNGYPERATSRDEKTLTWRYEHYDGDPPDFRVGFELGRTALELNGRKVDWWPSNCRVSQDGAICGRITAFTKAMGGEVRHEPGSPRFELHLRGKTITVEAGKREGTMDGTPLDLGGPPARVGGVRDDLQCRLDPIVKALGGAIAADLEATRVVVTLPGA